MAYSLNFGSSGSCRVDQSAPKEKKDIWRVTLNVPAKKPEGKIRIVCISDTHNRADELIIPDGDVLIHAGDWTDKGSLNDILRFNQFLAKLPHKHKIVIAGNHELSLGYYDHSVTLNCINYYLGQFQVHQIQAALCARGLSHPSQLLENCIYLNNSSVTLYGLKFYGSPWSSQRGPGWAYDIGTNPQVWDAIPDDADVLITHGPPLGAGDLSCQFTYCGCPKLHDTVTQRVKPKLHVFGHIHEGYGAYYDGTTIYINAAAEKLDHEAPLNPPICFDIDIPKAPRNKKNCPLVSCFKGLNI